jgi:hypothetical protein
LYPSSDNDESHPNTGSAAFGSDKYVGGISAGIKLTSVQGRDT